MWRGKFSGLREPFLIGVRHVEGDGFSRSRIRVTSRYSVLPSFLRCSGEALAWCLLGGVNFIQGMKKRSGYSACWMKRRHVQRHTPSIADWLHPSFSRVHGCFSSHPFCLNSRSRGGAFAFLPRSRMPSWPASSFGSFAGLAVGELGARDTEYGSN